MSFSEYSDATFSSAFYEPEQFTNNMMPQQQMNHGMNENNNHHENSHNDNEPRLSSADENKIKEILSAASENRTQENNRTPQISMPPMRMPETNPLLHNNNMQTQLINQLV